MDRQDPWLEFLDRLLVTASMDDVVSTPAEVDPKTEDAGGTAMPGHAASRQAAAGQALSRPGSPPG